MNKQKNTYQMLAEFTLKSLRPDSDNEKKDELLKKYVPVLEDMLFEASDITVQQFLDIIEIDETSDDPRITEIGKLFNDFIYELTGEHLETGDHHHD